MTRFISSLLLFVLLFCMIELVRDHRTWCLLPLFCIVSSSSALKVFYLFIFPLSRVQFHYRDVVFTFLNVVKFQKTISRCKQTDRWITNWLVVFLLLNSNLFLTVPCYSSELNTRLVTFKILFKFCFLCDVTILYILQNYRLRELHR